MSVKHSDCRTLICVCLRYDRTLICVCLWYDRTLICVCLRYDRRHEKRKCENSYDIDKELFINCIAGSDSRPRPRSRTRF